MTEQQARGLLRRTRLKGDELGRALLLNLAYDFKRRGRADAAPLFDQAELNRMEAALPSEYERDKYAEYVALHAALVQLFREAQGQLQQLQHGLYRLTTLLYTADRVFDLRQCIEAQRDLSSAAALDAVEIELNSLFPEDFTGLTLLPSLRGELVDAWEKLSLPSFRWLTGYNAMLAIYAQGLALPALSAMGVGLDNAVTGGGFCDELVARNLARLPKALASELSELCPPLAFGDIRADGAVVDRYVAQVRAQGPAGCPPFPAVEETMGNPREVC